MERIFTYDVGGVKAGQILELDWDAFRNSLAQHHGITDPLDSYSMTVEEAARRYVATITPREAAKSRRVSTP